MNKRTAAIGLVVLVVGVILAVGGALSALGSITINTTFTQAYPGEYVSAEIVLNTTSNLVVSSPAPSGGIVEAQNLHLVNSTNISTYTVPYNASGAGSDVYRSLSGDYYYVAFTSAQPATRIVATPRGSSALAFASLVLLGVVLAIAGIVLAVVGVLRKGPPASAGQT